MGITPYRNSAFNKLYNLLFCDDAALLRQSNGQTMTYPWNLLTSTGPSIEELKKLNTDKTAGTRAQILAANLLAASGHSLGSKDLMGVVIEVGLENGLDVLAAYKDGTARYINQAEKMIVWDSPTMSSQILIDNLFSAGEKVVNQIGPWKKPRLSQPANGTVRLSFLVSDGLYFGQGPFEVLSKDAMGGPVIQAATQLMIFLTAQN
jgi:hypothetical protein